MTAEQTEPTLAARLASATSHHDWQKIVLALTREVDGARAVLLEHEHGNQDAALAGASVFDEHYRKVAAASERVKALRLALNDAKAKEDEAETREILAKMVADAGKAAALVPKEKQAWKDCDAALEAFLASLDAVYAVMGEVDEFQAHAVRAERKDLIVSHVRVREETARECQRPILGPEAKSPMTDRDTFYVKGLVAVEAIQKRFMGVDAHDAKRNFALVSINPRQRAAGDVTVVPDGIEGRSVGGLGRGVR